MFEQQTHHGLTQQDQTQRRRQRQPHREFEAARLRVRNRCLIAAAQGLRHFWDQHRAHGDADDAERQLHQAVGEIEP